MKKIIVLITILCSLGFCDTIINVYNRTTGKIIKTFGRHNCKNKLEIDFINDMYYKDIKEMNFEIMAKDGKKIPINLVISCGKGINGKTLGYYDYSMFSYSIEKELDSDWSL